jgi:hypothetical protein
VVLVSAVTAMNLFKQKEKITVGAAPTLRPAADVGAD